MITAIVTIYRRPYALEEQLNAIRNQTVPPKEIIVLRNQDQDSKYLKFPPIPDEIKQVNLNYNSKFFGRFAWALTAQTPYVAIFDDDTVPGSRWFENCLQQMEIRPGIYGTIGVRLLSTTGYKPYQKVGWHTANAETEEVDLVGHAWFMKKEYLKYIWMEEPYTYENGEDIHLSYMALKYGDVHTYVPPHPPDDISLWGSLPEPGGKYGNDANATWRTKDHTPLRNEIVKNYITRGWKTLHVRRSQEF